MRIFKKVGMYVYFVVLFQRMKLNELCYKWGVYVVNLYSVFVIVVIEKLK